ncbi:MAG TPA: hypothetical protein VMB25_05630 [Bryobacteraceae bacterium]|nr:hypothetical protein [Bryobacteraceae bacterium]
MTRRNLPIALYLFLVFVSGAVVGALGYRTYNPPTARSAARLSPAAWRVQYLDEMQTRLSLTDDQMKKLNAILDDTNSRFKEAREKDNAAIEQIRQEHFSRVRTILTSEQIPKYEKLHEEREERARQQEKQSQR